MSMTNLECDAVLSVMSGRVRLVEHEHGRLQVHLRPQVLHVFQKMGYMSMCCDLATMSILEVYTHS